MTNMLYVRYMNIIHISKEVFDVCVELKKFRRYQIVMTSYNIIGESPPSSPVEVLVGEAGRWKLKEGESAVTFPTSGEHICC